MGIIGMRFIKNFPVLILFIISGNCFGEDKLVGMASYLSKTKIVVGDGSQLDIINDGRCEINGNHYVINRDYAIEIISEEVVNYCKKGSLQGKALSFYDNSLPINQFYYEFPHVIDEVLYSNSVLPIKYLSIFVQKILEVIQNFAGLSWGGAIVVFSLIFKLAMWPVNRMTARAQQRVSEVGSKLEDRLTEIKLHYDGEEAHNRLMAVYKEFGVSPFYTLKPMLGLFIQIPFWMAIFGALGEMPQFNGESFLWIENLAYPDSVAPLGFTLPFLGNQFNLLPIVMTIITGLGALLYKDDYASPAALRKTKFKLYMMATFFLVLFYPFPAAMVLYWTMANFLHLLQQQLGSLRTVLKNAESKK
ncbi:YidC/Oxa1 family membrane protein insertase [Vibrio sp. 10N.261.46.E11]|uniref:YidC/Oxa1 family membrane protein insertase n=1 Tax=Vibrio sp. 10N.261.46.E11 TaxID=3229662 RepID=UPI00354B28D6